MRQSVRRLRILPSQMPAMPRTVSGDTSIRLLDDPPCDWRLPRDVLPTSSLEDEFLR